MHDFNIICICSMVINTVLRMIYVYVINYFSSLKEEKQRSLQIMKDLKIDKKV